jgi:hypothetical protein
MEGFLFILFFVVSLTGVFFMGTADVGVYVSFLFWGTMGWLGLNWVMN